MLKPVWERDHNPGNITTRRRRRLRTVAMLPTLLTLGNLYFGFGAIYCCGRDLQDLGAGIGPDAVRTLNSVFLEKRAPSHLSIAVWMLIGAMVCDALDGRVARRTGQASKFGEQLDSLADMVSFGAAPALMMTTLVHREITQWGYAPLHFEHFGQVTVFIAVIYTCCAALRLARFNVEASLDEAAHQGFKGLPSPGAAAAVISLVFLHDHLDVSNHWEQTTDLLAKALPFCTLATALLMVSRVRYVHAVSFLLKRRPLEHVVLFLLALPLILIYTEQVAVIGAWFFALSGPARYVFLKLTGQPGSPDADNNDHQQPPATEASKQAL
jgi:CDP-diacylglycerol---serine O-phosphatidyltransferase